MAPAMKEFTRLLATIDSMIAAAAGALSAQTRDFECITSVPGIGLLSGSMLLGVFRRLADRGADAVIAFLGMDPRPMDSGQKSGLARMSKRGPAESRRLCSTPPCPPREPRPGRRSTSTSAPSTCLARPRSTSWARKLVRVAFSLFKSHSLFDQSLVATK